MRAIPNDTAGLKKPPETRMKIQMLTARENPDERAVYIKSDVVGTDCGIPVDPSRFEAFSEIRVTLTTLLPPHDMRIYMVVPPNSPIMATKSV